MPIGVISINKMPIGLTPIGILSLGILAIPARARRFIPAPESLS
jgi:hypothetical protein